MKRGLLFVIVLLVTIAMTPYGVFASVARTTYPVVFAHGMGGFDDIMGYDYWGDDYGVFVGDPCDGFLEVTCNANINSGQKSFIAQMQPFQSSEYRGTQLANQIESYMATTGTRYVNLVGHSQGGMDIRKAAKLLYQHKGYQVVKVMVSISSPHRGSPLGMLFTNQVMMLLQRCNNLFMMIMILMMEKLLELRYSTRIILYHRHMQHAMCL